LFSDPFKSWTMRRAISEARKTPVGCHSDLVLSVSVGDVPAKKRDGQGMNVLLPDKMAQENIPVSSPKYATDADDPTAKAYHVVRPWDDDEPSGEWDELKRVALKISEKVRHAYRTWTAWQWGAFFLPCLNWLPKYTWTFFIVSLGCCNSSQGILAPFSGPLQYDLIAGISVGFMVIPQGLSYANSAGVVSVMGLYGAFLPCLVYSLVGTSRQLAVGPVAVTSLIIYANLQAALPCSHEISNPNSITDPTGALQNCQAAYNRAAIQIAFIVACMYTGEPQVLQLIPPPWIRFT
jgi:hypothetical protein